MGKHLSASGGFITPASAGPGSLCEALSAHPSEVPSGQTRMRGAVGAGGEKRQATILGNIFIMLWTSLFVSINNHRLTVYLLEPRWNRHFFYDSIDNDWQPTFVHLLFCVYLNKGQRIVKVIHLPQEFLDALADRLRCLKPYPLGAIAENYLPI